jgi:hypothetical protein
MLQDVNNIAPQQMENVTVEKRHNGKRIIVCPIMHLL